MLLKIVGAIALIWVAFVVLGWVFKIFTTLLVIGVVVTLGAIAYGAIKGKMSGQIKS
jgi:hypothetical protein